MLPLLRGGTTRRAKRAVDLLIGSAALGAALPLMAAVAAAVRVTSPGPVVLKQVRIGLDGELFTVWKFRSIRADGADGQAQGRRVVMRADPRLTPIDAEYVIQLSFWLDVKILAGTVGVILRQQATAPAVGEVPGQPPPAMR